MALTPAFFDLLNVFENVNGWGPSSTPVQTDSYDFLPYSRGEKLGKASDWANAYSQRFPNKHGTPNDDEDSFRVVDSKPTKPNRHPGHIRRGGQRGRGRGGFMQRDQSAPQQQQQQQGRNGRQGGRPQGQGQQGNWQGSRGTGNMSGQWGDNRGAHWNHRPQREASVDVQPDWNVVEQFQFSALVKLSFEPDTPVDIVQCGALEYYNRAVDRTTPKAPRALERFERRVFHKATTSEDPVIQQMQQESIAQVFATDDILAAIMSAPRSVYSWDIVVHRTDDKLFFDKRGDSFDLLTVNETAHEPPVEDKDSINSVLQLGREATLINQNFSQQVLCRDGRVFQLPEANPFAREGEEVANVGYRYRKWMLGNVALVARCGLDAVLEPPETSSGKPGGENYVFVCALNEFDSKVSGLDWRRSLDSSRGAVLATEVKNNSNKLARWTSQAILSGADYLKLGFVSRTPQRDNHNTNYHHQLLSVQSYRPRELAQQINLNMHNAWGILREVIMACLKQPPGKYLLLKDPNKALLRLYEIPSADGPYVAPATAATASSGEEDDAAAATAASS